MPAIWCDFLIYESPTSTPSGQLKEYSPTHAGGSINAPF